MFATLLTLAMGAGAFDVASANASVEQAVKDNLSNNNLNITLNNLNLSGSDLSKVSDKSSLVVNNTGNLTLSGVIEKELLTLNTDSISDKNTFGTLTISNAEITSANHSENADFLSLKGDKFDTFTSARNGVTFEQSSSTVTPKESEVTNKSGSDGVIWSIANSSFFDEELKDLTGVESGIVTDITLSPTLSVGEGAINELCASLGSDLNVCLYGGRILAKGRGEIIEPLDYEEFNVSLIKPLNLGISAKEAYTKYSQKVKILQNLKYQNDLEWAVIDDYKELQYIKEKYPESVMTGSGSTYFVIGDEFENEKNYWVKNNLKSINYGVTVIN